MSKDIKYSSKVRNILYVGAAFLVVVFLSFFWVSSKWIGKSVEEKCMMAVSQYEGDCVEALIQVVDGQDLNTYKERNDAVWALGQIGDDRDGRTSEVIEKYYTGEIPNREPYDSALSQHEMKKALKLLDGGWNVTHLVWNPSNLID